MRRHFVGFLLFLAGSGLWLAFHARSEPGRVETARFSVRSLQGLPGELQKQSVSKEEKSSRMEGITAQDQFTDAGKPNLLVSWACASTDWETEPDMVYARGIAKNASSTELSDVAAEVTFISPGGATLGTRTGYLYHSRLAPEGISAFFVFLPAESQTPSCSVNFRDRDGPLRSIRASALEADAGHLFIGRWAAAGGRVSMDFFRNGTAFLVTDRGVALGAGRYKAIDASRVELRLSIPPEGVATGYLYPHDQWRALAGKTVWHYLPSKDALSLWTPSRRIVLTRGTVGSIGETVGQVTEGVVLEVQKKLKAEGFDPGPLDGVLGPGTRAALGAFQKSRKLQQTQELDEDTLWAMRVGWPNGNPPAGNTP